MSSSIGFVYILSNPSAPDLYKVGCSTNDPLERARQLSVSTSVAMPFSLVYSKRVEYPFSVESQLHLLLDQYRVNNSREFFRVPLHKIIDLIERYEEAPPEFAGYGEVDTVPTPWAELFSSFEDDCSDRELNDDERAQVRELAKKLGRRPTTN